MNYNLKFQLQNKIKENNNCKRKLESKIKKKQLNYLLYSLNLTQNGSKKFDSQQKSAANVYEKLDPRLEQIIL